MFRKICTISLISSLLISPVISGDTTAKPEKQKSTLAKAWETVKEYAVPIVGVITVVALGCWWKKNGRSNNVAPVVRLVQSQDGVQQMTQQLGGREAVERITTTGPIRDKEAVIAAANRAKVGLSVNFIFFDYEDTQGENPDIIAIVDRRNAQPYYWFKADRPGARIHGQPLRDFCTALDPQIDVSQF